jgi:hypothetical protein
MTDQGEDEGEGERFDDRATVKVHTQDRVMVQLDSGAHPPRRVAVSTRYPDFSGNCSGMGPCWGVTLNL